MATQSYRDLLVWRKSMELAEVSFRISSQLAARSGGGAFAEQLRRAAVSVPANIAEGAGRETRRSYAHFVRIARGSANEVETVVLLADRVLGVPPSDRAQLEQLAGEVGRLLTLLARALERQPGSR